MMTVGGGSSSLKVKKEYSPLEGIKERFEDADVEYERGYIGTLAVNTMEFPLVRTYLRAALPSSC